MTVLQTTPVTIEQSPTPADVCSAPPPRHPRPDGQDSYSISEVVAFTGLTAHTLRWYERIGLMSHIDRSHTGQRRYSNRDLDWLDLVGKLRLTGMPVADMVRYAELVREGDHTFGDRYELLENTRRDVRARIAELQDTLAVLDRKITFYGDATRARAYETRLHEAEPQPRPQSPSRPQAQPQTQTQTHEPLLPAAERTAR